VSYPIHTAEGPSATPGHRDRRGPHPSRSALWQAAVGAAQPGPARRRVYIRGYRDPPCAARSRTAVCHQCGGNCGRSLNLGRGNHGRGASLRLTRSSRAQMMVRDGMSRELSAEMLGYLGLPAGIAMMACRSSRPLQPCPVKSC
jgi:hypothetical protein